MNHNLRALILGIGGMAKALYDLLTFQGNIQVEGFLWADGTELCGLPIHNRIEDVDQNVGLVLGMLNPSYREEHIENLGKSRFIRVLDGNISIFAKVGHGAVIVRDSYVMAGAIINDFAHIHTHAIVGHDCIVGEHSFVGPGTILGGRSKIGRTCRLGMGSRVLPDVILEDNVTVAAGAVVTKNVASNRTVYGNPARSLFRSIRSRF
jgi:sugar O-acyltransferase (sialic acid O-acetyltransferase NeuD family)